MQNYLTDYTLNLKKKIHQVKSVIRLKPFDTSTDEGRSKERYRRVVLSAGSSFINKVVTTLTSLISVPLTVHYLGVERYGLWMTISSTIAFLTFADLGLGNGLINAVSKADGLDNRADATTAVSSAFFMLLGIAFSLVAIFWVIYPHVPWQRVFNVTSDVAIRESGSAMAVLMAAFLINMPLGIVQRIQMGYQEGYKNQLWLSGGAVLGLAGVLIVIYLKAGLPWLVLAISGGPLLATLMNGFCLFAFSRPWIFPRWAHFNLSVSKNLSEEEFMKMTDGVLSYIKQNGYRVEIKEPKSDKLKAFRRNIYFPELLFDLGLSGHRAERFLIKIESQDQQVGYRPVIENIKGCGFFFPFQVPPLKTLCSMKIAAMLSRQKGRDFYDVLFLMSMTKPDYKFLSKKTEINNLSELKKTVEKTVGQVDLNRKRKDFEHLLFNRNNSNRILRIEEFVKEL